MFGFGGFKNFLFGGDFVSLSLHHPPPFQQLSLPAVLYGPLGKYCGMLHKVLLWMLSSLSLVKDTKIHVLRFVGHLNCRVMFFRMEFKGLMLELYSQKKIRNISYPKSSTSFNDSPVTIVLEFSHSCP